MTDMVRNGRLHRNPLVEVLSSRAVLEMPYTQGAEPPSPSEPPIFQDRGCWVSPTLSCTLEGVRCKGTMCHHYLPPVLKLLPLLSNKINPPNVPGKRACDCISFCPSKYVAQILKTAELTMDRFCSYSFC